MEYKGIELSKLDMDATTDKISTLMKEKNVSVKEVSKILSISEQAVYKWKKGRALPAIDNLYVVAQILGVTVDEILVGAAFNVEWIEGSDDII